MMSTTVQDISRQLVVFSLGEQEYALPITRVQEIIRYEEPTGVASHTLWIRGVISLRGKIVPVCDLGLRLGVSSEPVRDAKIVIVETEGGTAGVIVDEVEEVLTVEREQVESAPAADSEFIEAIAKVDERLIIMLHPDGLFAGMEFTDR